MGSLAQFYILSACSSFSRLGRPINQASIPQRKLWPSHVTLAPFARRVRAFLPTPILPERFVSLRSLRGFDSCFPSMLTKSMQCATKLPLPPPDRTSARVWRRNRQPFARSRATVESSLLACFVAAFLRRSDRRLERSPRRCCTSSAY